jgi:hypothetical protein
MGCPMSETTGIVHFNSKTLLKTILKICCTLIPSPDALQKMRGAFIALANFRACEYRGRSENN